MLVRSITAQTYSERGQKLNKYVLRKEQKFRAREPQNEYGKREATI
jgi:hypothetical protein